MTARTRATWILGIIVVALFILRWPIDNYICNPDTWKSTTQKDARGRDLTWRPAQREGMTFFSSILRGGGGTPAVFAMFGGQRYMVANILWNYSDVLFHQQKPYDMIMPLESAVTLNPSFIDAWSVYGWHEAWNLQTYATTDVMKAKWLAAGEQVYQRAVECNPRNPRPYFDLAWLLLQRKGDYFGALATLQAVVEAKNSDGTYKFQPMTKKEKNQIATSDVQDILDRKWDPVKYGRRLAYTYRLIGIMSYNKDQKLARTYFDKAIATYNRNIELLGKDDVSKDNRDQLIAHMNDDAWLAKQRKTMETIRNNYGMPDFEIRR